MAPVTICLQNNYFMNHIINQKQYDTLIATWKHTKSHTASAHIIYNILRGYDLRHGFTPITNSTKLANGYREWTGHYAAISTLVQLLRGSNKINMAEYADEIDVLLRPDSINTRINITPGLQAKLLELLK